MKQNKFKIAIMLTGLLAAASTHAEDKFSVSGFGYQDYRQTNGNVMDGADKRGTWENDIIAFVISAKISDRDTAVAQLESTATEPTSFTWAFFDHRFNDNLSLHIGRVKFPLGVYNEFVDNKWLQLGVIHPSIYAPQADMVHDAYTGIGIDWTAGSLFTQIYAGHIYDNPPIDSQAVTPFSDRRMLGGRITWNTPLDGLRFLVSAYTTTIESTVNNPNVFVPGQGMLGHENRSILSVDYVTDRFDIKGEYATHKVTAMPAINLGAGGYNYDGSALNADAWFVQGGYKFGDWTPYVRIDSFLGDKTNTSDPSLYQKDKVVGVSYRINENVNVRIEYLDINGWGLTENGSLVLTGSENKKDWNQVAAGLNFIF